MSYLTALARANPPFQFAQADIAAFMVQAMQLQEEAAEKLKILFRASGIETRFSVVEDYGRTSSFTFFPNNQTLSPFPSTRQRMELYQQHALGLSARAASACLEKASVRANDITHLIVVSCTGQYAPGLDIDLVHQLQLPTTVARTSIQFMGCYAAFSALRLADAFCKANAQAKVLVVCTELCSLHFQKEETEDNVLANALFADGSAALLVESTPRSGISLNLNSFHCDLIPEASGEMAWRVGNYGFEMRLSAYVPQAIRGGIHRLMKQWTTNHHGSFDFYAVHPGGKKILQVIEDELGIDRSKNKHAHDVLRKFGNMSAPTILFVLHEIMQQLTPADQGKKILGLGFGPGLTLESIVLSVYHS